MHHPHQIQPASQADGDPSHDSLPDLTALSAATERYARTAGGKRRRARPSVLFALVTAIVMGAALTLAGGFEYRCAATLRISGEGASQRRKLYRNELLAYAWDQGNRQVNGAVAPGRWLVDSPSADVLQLCIITPDRGAGIDRARRIGQGFCDKVRAEAAAERETPSQAEGFLTDYSSELQTRLDEAQLKLDTAFDALPSTDPFDQHSALRAQWQELRSDFGAARERLALAVAEIVRLRSDEEPTGGLVPAEERRQALEADDALQQDLRELVVNLSEVKVHGLDGWRRSVAPLEQLVLAADALVKVASPSRRRIGSRTADERAEQLMTTAVAYRETIQAFSERWNSQFAALERLDLDPSSRAVLDGFDHVQRELNDFLFDARQRLTAVRSAVRAVGEDPSSDARRHVFLSNLTRAFQTIPAVHHRFEFAARALDTDNNYRLDAALTTAHSLRRRTRERIGLIEEQLRAEASERARRQRLQQLSETEQLVGQLRDETDRALDLLFALQEELHLGVEQVDIFSRALIRTEVVSGRLALFQDNLRRTQRKMRKLAADRVSDADAVTVEFVSSEAFDRPVNLAEQMRVGGLGAGLAFLTVLLGQWWIIRRS